SARRPIGHGSMRRSPGRSDGRRTGPWPSSSANSSMPWRAARTTSSRVSWRTHGPSRATPRPPARRSERARPSFARLVRSVASALPPSSRPDRKDPPMSSDAPAASDPRLDPSELARLDAWWRAANYLSVGQIYLLANPLLREPLRPEHVKVRLLGHWGTTPGLNFINAHVNRVIAARDLDAIWIVGPGHGGPAAVANAWLEGTYTEQYPQVTMDEPGMARLFRQFSFP